MNERRTHPEDTDSVERTVRWSVRFDHAEHAMQLPIDEKHNKQMVRVPKALKVRPTAFLHRIPHHHAQRKVHNPPGHTRARREVSRKERNDALPRRRRAGIRQREFGEVDHVRDDVHDGEEDDGPGDHFVEGDVLVEGDDVVEWGAPEEGDEVPADGEEDEDDIDVEDEGC